MALLLHKVTSTTYFVIPDDHSSHHMDTNTFSLQHYFNNTSKYFVSHNQFHFMQGQYYINNDLVIKDVDNFTITGIGQCTIISFIGILIVNVKNNSKIINIRVKVNFHKYATFNIHPMEISSLKVIYSYDMISTFGLLTIDNFYYNYNNYVPHENDFLCVIFIIFLQNDKINYLKGT